MTAREGDESLYELLGVAEAVTAQEIRALRRELARRYHPDVAAHPDPARLGRVLSACDVLCDPVRRAHYDARRAREAPQRRARQAEERREREAAEERERAAAARRAQRSPDDRRRADFSAALRGEAAHGAAGADAAAGAGAGAAAAAAAGAGAGAGAGGAPAGLRMAGLTAARPRRRTRGFDWDGAVTRAVCYALGAATVPGYVSAFVIGGWLTPASTFETDPHPVLLNGPILIVLGVQAALAAGVSLLVDVRAWRRRLRAPGRVAADGS